MADRIEGLSIGLDLDSIALERGLTGVKDRLRTVNSEMKKNMSAFDRSDRSIQKYETRVQGLNKKLDVQKKVTEEAYREYQKMVQEHGEGSKQAEKAERAYNNQAAALNNLERYVENATEELEAMRKEQEFLDSGMGKLTTGLDKFSGTMKRTGDTLTGVGKTLSMRVTAPIMAAGGAAIAAADQFDKAYRDIRVGTGATGDALEDLEQSFDNVFTSVPDGADQVANALATLNTFTGATNEVLEDLTTNVLDVSRLLGEDATANSQAFGKAMEQWQIPAEEGVKHLDYLYKITQDYGVGLGEINGHLTTYGAVLNNAGFNMDEAAHFMASLEKNGIAVSRIMPGLNKSFRNWADEGKNSREELEKVVEKIAETEDKQKALTLATEAFGAEGAQRLMTAIRNRAIPAFEDLGAGAEDARGSIQETAEETKTIGEEFAELKNNTLTSLRPIGDILLNLAKDYLPPIIDGVTNLAKWFDELDDSTKKTIVTVGGIAAVAGPASLALGGIFKIVGSLAGGLSTITGILGRAGGAGLLGRIGLLGAGASLPVGLAIAGVTALGGAIHYLTRDTDKYSEASFDKVNKMKEEIDATDELIAEFEKLQIQNQLTADEMLEYMDILDDLSSTSSPDKIAELRDRQAELLEKSGFTNDEMEDFLELNEEIVKKSPNTVTAISEQGNAYTDNLQVLKDLNAEKREEMMMVAEQELLKGLRDELDLLEEQKELQQEKNEAMKDYQKAHDEYISAQREANELAAKRRDLEVEMQGLIETYGEDSQQVRDIALEIADLSDEQIVLEKERLDTARDNLDTAKETLGTKEEDLDKINEQLKKIDDLKYEYEALWLAHLDINAEKGESLNAIEKELGLLDQQKKDLEELHDKGIMVGEDYRNAKEEIEQQRDRLIEAKRELQQINDLASETAYKKDVELNVTPSIHKINQEIADTVYKRVRVGVDMQNAQRLAYADGTPPGGHPIDGPAIVGDGGGRELIALPNGKMFLSPSTDTMLNLPKGTHVVPHQETRKLLSGTPKYASGTSGWRGLVDNLRDSEFMKLLAIVAKKVDLPNTTTSHRDGNGDYTQQLLNATLEQNKLLMELLEKDTNTYLDSRLLGKSIEPHVTEQQRRKQSRQRRASFA